MQAFFLEEPFYLIPSVLLFQLILVSHWLRARSSNAKRIAFAGLALFSCLILLQVLIKTDREHLREICRELTKIVERADAAAFGSYLADDLSVQRKRGEPWDREALIERFEKTLRVYRVEDSQLHRAEIETQGNRATVSLRVACRIIGPTERFPSLFSRWELDFVKSHERWKLRNIRRGSLEPVGVDLLDEML